MSDNRKDELHLQMRIADYIKREYPSVLFYSSMTGIRLTIGQAMQNKHIQDGRKWPDIFIAEPSNIFFGLFGEIKLNEGCIYNAKGEYLNEHIKAQANMLELLRGRGYKANFWAGFDEARVIIDKYLAEVI